MQPEHMSEEVWVKWTKKRKRTFIGYIIVGSVVGLDYSFMFTTLYLYLKEMVKCQNPDLFYGLIIGVYSVSSTLSGVVCGRWVDRMRKMRLYTMSVLLVQILGCVLYVVHLNVVFPLLGRLIGGMGDPFTSVTSGEIVRIYDNNDSTKALWWIASVYSIGLISGPVVVLFFKDVDFHIWSIHVTQLNFIAIFMALLLSTAAFLAPYLMYDCSAEFDLKEYLHQQTCEKKKAGRNTELNTDPASTEPTDTTATTMLSTLSGVRRTSAASTVALIGARRVSIDRDTVAILQTLPVRRILKTLLRNVDTRLMFVSTFVFVYCLFSADVLTPLLILNKLNWSLQTLSYVDCGCGIQYFLLLMSMSNVCTSDSSVYCIGMVCIGGQICMFASLIFMVLSEREKTSDIIYMLFYVFFWAFSYIIEEVIMRCMLSKMVPSSMQSFVESIRNGVSRLSTVVASITTPFVMNVLTWWSTGFICVVGFLLLAFIARRKELSNIDLIDFNSCKTVVKCDGDNQSNEVCSDLMGRKEIWNMWREENLEEEVSV